MIADIIIKTLINESSISKLNDRDLYSYISSKVYLLTGSHPSPAYINSIIKTYTLLNSK